MNNKPTNYKPSGSQVRPWSRFIARYLDIYLFIFIFGFSIRNVSPSLERSYNYSDPGIGLFVVLIYQILVEPFMLCTYGTTPGKFIFGIRLRRHDGEILSYAEALKRSFSIWMRGLGFGIGIVGLFTLFDSYNRLVKNGKTEWDQVGRFVVSHKDPFITTKTGLILIFGFLVLVFLLVAFIDVRR